MRPGAVDRAVHQALNRSPRMKKSIRSPWPRRRAGRLRRHAGGAELDKMAQDMVQAASAPRASPHRRLTGIDETLKLQRGRRQRQAARRRDRPSASRKPT
jgi:hypothetical protein